MLSLSSLGRAVLPRRPRAQGDHRLLRRHVPELHAQPDLRRRVPARRGRGRALVVPRVLAAPRGRGARAARGHDALDRRVVDGGRTTRYARVDTPFGEVGLLAPLVPDVALLHAPVADRAGNVALAPAAARGRVGRARGAAGRDRHRRAGRRRPAAVGAPRAHPRAPGARGVRGPDGRASRRAVRPATCRSTATARTTSSGSRRARRAGATTTTSGSGTGCSTSTTRTSTSTGSAPSASARCAAKADPDSWQADEARVPARSRRAARTGGSSPRSWGARHLAERVVALDADAVLAGAGVANLAAWLGVRAGAGAGERRAAHRRDRAVGLRPRRPPTRSCSTTATSRARRCSATRRWCSGTLVGGPGTTTIACLGGAQVDRHGNINSTRIPDGPFLVGSGGGNDVASVAAESSSWRRSRRSARRPSAATSRRPGARCGRSSPTSASLEKPAAATSSCSPRCRRVTTPIADRIEAARAACGWDLEVAPDVASSRRRRPTRSRRCAAGTREAGSSASARDLRGRPTRSGS